MAVVSESPRRSVDRSFEHLYRKHVAAVYRYSLALLGDPADAEDVTQTTFLNAYRAYSGGERPRKPENWLITIAHNVCRQRFRQAQSRPSEVRFEEDTAGAPEPDENVPTPAELRRAFEQLAPRQRAALVMRELEGRNYDEIAAVLGLSKTALETLLFRARRALREQLEEQLTCREAAFAISKQMDGELSRRDARALRRHLRACPVCRELAQTQTRHRQLLRRLLAVPLPTSLHSFFGHGGVEATAAAGVGAGTAVKVAGVVAALTVAGGVYEADVRVAPPFRTPTRPALVAHAPAPPSTPVRLTASPNRKAASSRTAPAAHAVATRTPSARASAAAAAPGRALGRTKAHATGARASAHAPTTQGRPAKASPQRQAKAAQARATHRRRSGPSASHAPPERTGRGRASDSLMTEPRLPSPRGPIPPHSP